MTNGGSHFRTWLVALAACAAAVLFSMAYVDRAVADYVHVHLLQSQIIQGFAMGLGPLVIFVGLGFIVLGVAGCFSLAGRALSTRFDTPLMCSWSLVWAMAATEALKIAFGRSETEMWTGFIGPGSAPGTYGFHFMHGELLFESFPSGTTAIAAAILSVLWIRAPRFRIAWALVLAYVGFALIVTNGHFVADVIGGAFLGVSTGWMTVLLWQRPR
jgi:membrane-associated phospholipid phosphatase